MINWDDIDVKGKTSGQTKVKCPACIDQRSNKADKSLSVSFDKGLANCHYCGEYSIRDYQKIEKPVNYDLPPQEWQNYTNLSDKIVKYFSSRGISQRTLIDCKVTEEEYYQPAKQKKVNNIVFNYFEGDTLVNKKYRSATKDFTQSKGTRSIFYGINDIIGKEQVYIVEGELDKLSLWEIGIKNCISLPNGANDNDDVWQNAENYLSDVKTFFIATDMDEKGNIVADKIAQRLGRYRCERVKFSNKDANDDLQESKLLLEQSIQITEKYPVSGTVRINDFKGAIFDLYTNGLPHTISPKNNGLERLKNDFSIMRGHLVTVTGIPSHGKSTFLEWYILNLLAENDLKCSFFSPEHQPLALHQSNFIQKFYGKSFWNSNNLAKVTKTEIEDYINWANEKIYHTCPEKNQTPDWDFIYETFKEQVYGYGIDMFVIDAFNKVSLGGGNKIDNIGDVLTNLTSLAQTHNCIIFLVAHPTKMKKNDSGTYDVPNLYDVA
jgi:twinkle protein